MMIRKPGLLLSSCPPLANSHIFCITSSSPTPQLPRGHNHRIEQTGSLPERPLLYQPASRNYASVSHPPPGKPAESFVEHKWPSSPNPTPYEIFAQSKDTRYNKAVFYNLVKIYHPDRHHLSSDSLSSSVRLERYRLVVAANAILSDPTKRRAYDLYGAGWGGDRAFQDLYREADRSWRNRPGNASNNATWEDWDRWYRERDGEKPPQTPVYMSNELFVAVLCAFVILGSMAQARRANSHTMTLVEMREEKHAAISDGMRKRRDELAPLTGHEKVERFLRHRESWNVPASDEDDSISRSRGS